jgi:hypothetical protein
VKKPRPTKSRSGTTTTDTDARRLAPAAPSSSIAGTPGRPTARPLPVLLGLVLGGALCAVASPVPAQPFVEVAGEAGILAGQQSLRDPEHCRFPAPDADPSEFGFGAIGCVPARFAGGAAVADVDGDGLADLILTRFEAPDLLLLNQGDGTYLDEAVERGLAHLTDSNGVAPADFDNDGDADLYFTAIATERYFLFLNDGSGHFSEAAVERSAALASPHLHAGTSAAVGDADRDGWLDLFAAEWRPRALVDASAPSNNALLRNLGHETPAFFETVTEEAGLGFAVEEPAGEWVFSPAFVDLDSDGWSDLPIVADFGNSLLLWNDGDGTFSDGTVAARVGTDFDGMGSAFGDVDGDGDLDWFVSAITYAQEIGQEEILSGNRLYRYDGNREFTDITDAAGVREGGWGWGAVFADFDNDGDVDLVQTNGYDDPSGFLNQFEIYLVDRTMFWRNDGGSFTEASEAAGITDRGQGRAVLIFDYQQDGDLDLLITVNGGLPLLYRNDLPAGSGWLRVKAVGATGGTNRDGIGAVVRVHADAAEVPQVRHIGVAGHYLAASETTAHFGFGDRTAPVARLSVTWPRTGEVSVLDNVELGQTVVVRECEDNDPDSEESWEAARGCVHTLVGIACGDADRNGKVNATDALTTLLAAVGRGSCDLRTCDASGDRKVLASDALAILQTAVGIEVALACDFSSADGPAREPR